MSTNRPEELIKKYLNNTCTPEERAALESWYNRQEDSMDGMEEPEYHKIEKDIWKNLQKTTKPKVKINWSYAAAAAILITVCSTFYFSTRKTKIKLQNTDTVAKIMPGSNKAELLLEDGTVVSLSDDTAGVLPKQAAVKITKLPGGHLKYDAIEAIAAGAATALGEAGATAQTTIKYNTLRTPRGGQYQVNLPDGTKAWLNANSSLKFPTSFNGEERIVEASGEVYFEVAVNKHKPFKVLSPGQTITVLGTHFNLSAYPDEQITETSLMEGSVKVTSDRKTVIIKPGEQTLFNSSTKNIRVQSIDMDEVIAWRQGYFQFNDEDIKGIMRKLSRWYDIDVSYSKDFINQSFNGSISRFEDASKVLRMLEHTGTIHFKTEGRRVTVMP